MHQPIFATQMEDVAVAALILWRATHLFNVEEGPFGIVTRLRVSAGNGFIGGLLDCFYCLSLWLAIPVAIFAGENWAQRLLLWPALSGVACLLEQATKRKDFPGIYEETKE
jgi:hypothetical protein